MNKFLGFVKNNVASLFSVVLIVILAVIPTGFEDAIIYQNAEKVQVEIISVDDSSVIDTGLIRSGEQSCQVLILEGIFKGQECRAVNMLQGSLESDKVFAIGDNALAVVYHDGENIKSATLLDHFRLSWEIVLAGVFILFLVLFAGKTGFHAVLSFVLTVLCVWKVLVPLFLKGWSPVITGLIITAFLTIMIIGLVYNFDRRFLAAVTGSCGGLAVTCILGIVFTNLFKIHGAIMSYSESLLYSGYQNLSLTEIFMAAIFIGSSGAIMDLAVDITSAVHEVVKQNPLISAKEAIKSGFAVGKAAMGTMTTTLLLAYSGGYIALLMVFMAQGTPVVAILNYKYVSAEIVHTIVGSFGLVLVAPITAICAGMFLTKKKDSQ